MRLPVFRLTAFLSTLTFTLGCGIASAAPAARIKLNPPPSAELNYSVKARQSGMTLTGDTVIQWNVSGNSYSVADETRAMLVGKIISEKSEGAIDDYGLAPQRFTEKRFRKSETTTTFDRKNGTISFSESPQTYPIKGGEQDRASAMWQLISIARAAPTKFKAGSSWTFLVAGQRDADQWTFKVGRQEKIATTSGEVSAWHISRVPGSSGQQLDIWLAPSKEWYPVRLRLAEPDGEYVEQNLEKITKK
jgi:hypothetical protein